MPLNVRPIALSFAAISFFIIAIIGSFSGLSPFTCCKRSLIGAFFAYIAATIAVKAINAILINAVVTSKLNKQKENDNASRD